MSFPWVFDLHSDILNDVAWRRSRGERRVIVRHHLPGLRAAGVAAIVMAAWVESFASDRPALRLAELWAGLAAELAESPQELALVRSAGDIEVARGQGKLAIVMGAEGLGWLDGRDEFLPLLAQAGMRLALLTWNEANAFASGAGSHRDPSARKGLTEAGRRALDAMARLGVVTDVSHLDERSFWDIVDHGCKRLLASHSNARALAETTRNLTDDQIRAVAASGGLVGVTAVPSFLGEGRVGIDRFIDHVVHIANLTGIDHVALGLDFADYLPPPIRDGLGLTGGRVVEGLSDVSGVPALLERFAHRGFSDEQIARIAHGNALRLFEQVLPRT